MEGKLEEYQRAWQVHPPLKWRDGCLECCMCLCIRTQRAMLRGLRKHTVIPQARRA